MNLSAANIPDFRCSLDGARLTEPSRMHLIAVGYLEPPAGCWKSRMSLKGMLASPKSGR